jgi:hypothetical protein
LLWRADPLCSTQQIHSGFHGIEEAPRDIRDIFFDQVIPELPKNIFPRSSSKTDIHLLANHLISPYRVECRNENGPRPSSP